MSEMPLTIENTLFERGREEFLQKIKPKLQRIKETLYCSAYCLFFWDHSVHQYTLFIAEGPEVFNEEVQKLSFNKNILPIKIQDVVKETLNHKTYEIDGQFYSAIEKFNFHGFYYIPIISKLKIEYKQKFAELFFFYDSNENKHNTETVQDLIDSIVLGVMNFYGNIRLEKKTNKIRNLFEIVSDLDKAKSAEEIYDLITQKWVERFKNLYYDSKPGPKLKIILRLVEEGDRLKLYNKEDRKDNRPFYLSKDEPIFQSIFRDNAPFFVTNFADKDMKFLQFLEKQREQGYKKYADGLQKNVKSLLCIPIKVQGKIEGIFIIRHNRENSFGASEVRYFDDLAHLSALALNHLRAQEIAEIRERKKVLQLRQLNKLVKKIIKEDEKGKLLKAILDAGLTLVNAKSGTIRLLDREENILRPPYKEELVSATLAGNRETIKVGQGICGKVVETKKGIIKRDIFEEIEYIEYCKKKHGIDPRKDPNGTRISILKGKKYEGWIRSEISVPLIVDDVLLGVMDAYHIENDYFTHDDLSVFQNLAALSALAIRKSKLSDQINTIGEIINYYQKARGTNLEEFLNLVLEKTLEVLEVQKGYIAIKEMVEDEPKMKFVSLKRIKNLGLYSYRDLTEGIMGKAAAKEFSEPLQVGNVKKEEVHMVIDPDICSELLAPMIFDDKLQGILMVASKRENRFTKDDELIISTIARATAVYIHNILLLQEKEYARITTEKTIRSMTQQTGLLAHQIRNPLAIIGASAEILDELTCQEQQSVREQVSDIINGIQEMDKTIQHMLDSAHKAVSSNVVENIHNVLDETIAFIKILKKKQNITIEKEYDSVIESFSFNKFMIQQSLINILLNAYNALEIKGDTIFVKTQQKADKTYIALADNGPDMDEKTKEKIFEPGFTTKESGFGFGLSLCQDYVKYNDGQIKVDSQIGEGATFTIILPYKRTMEGINAAIN